MQPVSTFLVLAAGLFVRLALPIALTILVIVILRRLDARWQLEAEQSTSSAVAEIKCWEMKHCTPEQREACLVPDSGQPCWQERRLKNGYLREECLSCEVFEQAPVPAPAQVPMRS
ncbi:MAG: hypothetical protein ACM3QS_07680 [Bacteroidota bacterium]